MAFMSFLVNAVVFRMSLIPLFSPMLLHLVVIGVGLTPVLSFLHVAAELKLPLVAPLLLLALPMVLTPFLKPLLISFVVSSPLLAVALLNHAVITIFTDIQLQLEV